MCLFPLQESQFSVPALENMLQVDFPYRLNFIRKLKGGYKIRQSIFQHTCHWKSAVAGRVSPLRISIVKNFSFTVHDFNSLQCNPFAETVHPEPVNRSTNVSFISLTLVT